MNSFKTCYHHDNSVTRTLACGVKVEERCTLDMVIVNSICDHILENLHFWCNSTFAIEMYW